MRIKIEYVERNLINSLSNKNRLRIDWKIYKRNDKSSDTLSTDGQSKHTNFSSHHLRAYRFA